MKKLNLLYLLVFLSFHLFGQDANYSQFFANKIKFNPAYSGENNGKYDIGIQHRDQWSSVSEPYKASSFFASSAINVDLRKKNYFGAGIYVISDKAGKSDLSLLNAAASVAFHLKMDRYNTFSTGIKIGYNQRSINFDNLAWDSQYNGVSYDPTLPSNENFGSLNQKNMDLSGGLLLRHERKIAYEIGYAFSHYFQDQGLLETGKDELIMKQVISTKVFYRYANYDFNTYFNFTKQGGASEYYFGAVAGYRYGMDSKITTNLASSSILGGVFYRLGDAIIPMVGYEYQRMVRAYLSYDINISSLNSVSNYRGGWEITIQYLGLLNDTRQKIK